MSLESSPWTATLISNQRITPNDSAEDVRRLRFGVADPGFEGRIGQCLKALAPGQYGQRWHERLYSIADLGPASDCAAGFELLVRRCHLIDDFNGERYDGVASNYLCNLNEGARAEFSGPVGHPFPVPDDPEAALLMIGMGTGIAPFRGLVRRIYEEIGGWRGPVRLFYGARSGLEMRYLNDEGGDLGLYYDRPTFQAFLAVSPKPHFDAPPALDRALWERVDEIWSMLQDARTHIYLAGPETLLPLVETALGHSAGSMARWNALRAQMSAEGRWHDVLY